MEPLAAAGAGTAAGTAGKATGAGAAPGITPTAGPEAALAAPPAAAGRSSTLVPPPALVAAWFDVNASSKVLTKNTVAQTAVERERKLALPVAPKRLPEEPLPKEAPMSAPLPCCTSTKPIMPRAESICTARRRVIQICMMESFSKKEFSRLDLDPLSGRLGRWL